MIEKMSENLSNKKNLLSINRLALELQKEWCAFVPLN
jgi:hypothetical protein